MAADPFETLFDMVHRGTGGDLREYKQDQFRRRLLSWADDDLVGLGRRLATEPKAMRALLDRVSMRPRRTVGRRVPRSGATCALRAAISWMARSSGTLT